jgi:hypothetical protein
MMESIYCLTYTSLRDITFTFGGYMMEINRAISLVVRVFMHAKARACCVYAYVYVRAHARVCVCVHVCMFVLCMCFPCGDGGIRIVPP